MKNYFLSGLVVFFIFSCGNSSQMSDYGQMFKKIMLNETGIFRGISLDNDYEKIKSSENGTLLEGDSTYLFYEYKLDSNDTFTVEYQFEKNKLSDVRLDVYVKNLEEWKILFENFREYYNSKYGLCAREKDSFIWKINHENIHLILSDESVSPEEGVLSLEIFYASFPS